VNRGLGGDRGGIPVWVASRSSFVGHPTRSISDVQAYGSCRTHAKRTERVSHRSLDGAGERAAHRLHRPSSSGLIKNENKPENGRRDVMEMAPNQAKTSGSLRAIFDSRSLDSLGQTPIGRRG
jgi:hypothetical protein